MLVFVADEAGGSAVTRLLEQLGMRRRELDAEIARVVVVAAAQSGANQPRNTDAFPMALDEGARVHRRVGAANETGNPAPAVFVTDRFREIFAAFIPRRGSVLPDAQEIIEWLVFINISVRNAVRPSGRGSHVPVAAQRPASRSRHELAVQGPFRLPLTVSVLRRLSTNLVDVLTPGGEYVRALAGSRGPVIARVTQTRPKALSVALEGDGGEHGQALDLVRRMLGVDRDLTPFDRAAAGVPWLMPLAARMRGVKPPRYATLWEACVNVIVFQQISLQAASAIMERLIVALGRPVEAAGVQSYVFPGIESVLGARDDLLRAAGLSPSKLATLRRVGEALVTGTLDEAMLEERESPEAAALLCGIKGIGPWTAAVVLLRGLGRLDVFPANDSSVARNLTMVAGTSPLDVDSVVGALHPQQGMLYYHLLLARLESRGELGRPSASRTRASQRVKVAAH